MPTKTSSTLEYTPSSAKTHRSPLQTGLLFSQWLLLLLTTVWRTFLSLQITFNGTFAMGQAAVVIHWRQIDLLLGWAALLLFNLGRENALRPTSLGMARANRSFALFAAISLSFSLLSTASNEWGIGGSASTFLTYLADILLALTGLITVVRELRFLARDIPSGRITLLHLWRLLSAQWLLAWISAVVILRFTMKQDTLASNEGARQLLFALPAIGLLPNVLMWVGIRWWNELLLSEKAAMKPHSFPQPRARAWLLALFSMNLGALLMVIRIPAKFFASPAASQSATASPGIPGAILIFFAIIMYLVGFPPATWKRISGSLGKPMLLAWMSLLIAILLALTERLLSLGEFPISLAFLAAAWRHLLTAAALLWLFAIGTAAQDRLLPEHHRLSAHRMAFLATLCFAIGAAITTLLLLATALAQGEAQTPRFRLLFLGTLPELLALLIAGMTLLRTRKLLRQEAT